MLCLILTLIMITNISISLLPQVFPVLIYEKARAGQSKKAKAKCQQTTNRGSALTVTLSQVPPRWALNVEHDTNGCNGFSTAKEKKALTWPGMAGHCYRWPT